MPTALCEENIRKSSDEGDSPSSWNESLYDENGNLVKTTEYLAGYLQRQYEYEYNAEGVRTHCIGLYYVASASAYANSLFEYDGSGALAKERTDYNGKEVSYYITYYRDENGERILSENNEYFENGMTRPALYRRAWRAHRRQLSYRRAFIQSGRNAGRDTAGGGAPKHFQSQYGWDIL